MVQSDSSDDVTRTHVPIGKGTAIGHYRIVDKIGAGGMGEVYKAKDTRLNRLVAVKVLLTKIADNDEVYTFALVNYLVFGVV